MECRITENGQEYVGFKNVDVDGRKCQPWLGRANDIGDGSLELIAFPDERMDSSHSFCRNPDAKNEGPWCFTGEGTDKSWGRCDVPFCFQVYERLAVEGTVCLRSCFGDHVTFISCEQSQM